MGGPRQTSRHRRDGGACRADRATPVQVSHADRPNSSWSFLRSLRRCRWRRSAVAGPFEDAQAAQSTDAMTQPRYGSGVRWPTKATPRRSTHSGSLRWRPGGPKLRRLQSGGASQPMKAIPSPRNLETLYENGNGVPQNKTEALKWYDLAADRGNDGAQFNVGVLHFAGVAVSETRIQAAKWFRRAAYQVILERRYILASVSYGTGRPQDILKHTCGSVCGCAK